jgi:hypothetical protein
MDTEGRAWRWLAACAKAASPRAHALLPLRVWFVAMVWTQMIAPHQTPADVSDTGLLGAPSDVFSLIKDIAAQSAGDIDAAQPLWPPDVDPGSMSVAEALRGSAA